jgi:hypothetical protein
MGVGRLHFGSSGENKSVILRGKMGREFLNHGSHTYLVRRRDEAMALSDTYFEINSPKIVIIWRP